MPSPRAVLADITDFKLDPTVAYVTTQKKGRLANLVSHELVQSVQEQVVEEKVEEFVDQKEEPIIDQQVVEVAQEVQSLELVESEKLVQEQVVEEKVEESTKKRGGKKSIFADKG